MNLSKIYSDAVTPESVLQDQQAAQINKAMQADFDPAVTLQTHETWMRDPETVKFFKGLMHVFQEIVDKTLVNATSSTNPQQVISQNNVLIVADTIKKVIDYGRTNKW